MASAATARNGRSTSDVVFLGRRRLRLDERDLIGEGGEGRVYRIGALAVKVFTVPDAAREQKLRAFPTLLPPRVVSPLDLVEDGRGSVVGFSMRALAGAVDLHRFSQRRWRDGRVESAAVLALFRDLGATVERLHARAIVVGDLNDGNVVVTPPSSAPLTAGPASWTPWLIDADSMQFGAHRCVVAHERFLDPRLYGIDLGTTAALSRESDWYALAVLLFGSLLYVHPFGGAHPSHGTMLRRAEARCSVLRSDVKLPSAAVRPDVLSDDALAWFERVFEHDLREPLPSFILDTRFVRCACGAEHSRRCCPACTARVHVTPAVRARGRLRATPLFATRRGRIVAAVVQSGLHYAYEEDGQLFREGGAPVLPSAGEQAGAAPAGIFRDPTRIVRIAGSATWVGARGRAVKLACQRVLESRPIGLVHGELAVDAGLEGLVLVEGDALVRSANDTRIGQVLAGQTRVRVGSSLGFAFYRAGSLTVAFVFDPRRGVLRQIEAFPRLEGKLVGWSAVFDEAHVLVTFGTEKRGRLEHTAHLVDARGAVIATDPSGDVLGPSLAGRAISGGNVIVAREDGLVLLRADRAAARFVPVRLFPEAEDLVSPDAELLVGPGGSIFVVTHDDINHLCFTTD